MTRIKATNQAKQSKHDAFLLNIMDCLAGGGSVFDWILRRVSVNFYAFANRRKKKRLLLSTQNHM
jgi:hypothetical protein